MGMMLHRHMVELNNRVPNKPEEKRSESKPVEPVEERMEQQKKRAGRPRREA